MVESMSEITLQDKTVRKLKLVMKKENVPTLSEVVELLVEQAYNKIYLE